MQKMLRSRMFRLFANAEGTSQLSIALLAQVLELTSLPSLLGIYIVPTHDNDPKSVEFEPNETQFLLRTRLTP